MPQNTLTPRSPTHSHLHASSHSRHRAHRQKAQTRQAIYIQEKAHPREALVCHSKCIYIYAIVKADAASGLLSTEPEGLSYILDV